MNAGAVHDDGGALLVFSCFGHDAEKFIATVIEPDDFTIHQGVFDGIGPAFFLGEVRGVYAKGEAECDEGDDG